MECIEPNTIHDEIKDLIKFVFPSCQNVDNILNNITTEYIEIGDSRGHQSIIESVIVEDRLSGLRPCSSNRVIHVYPKF